MTLANASPFIALAAPLVAPDGRDVVLAVVKATFRRGRTGALHLADDQAPIHAADVAHFPEAEDSSLKYPTDLCVSKQGTDVVILGDAISRRPVEAMDVITRVRDRIIPLRVHGERFYYHSFTGVAIGPAAPFERKPIVYERAYGGTSADKSRVERRNPVGRGFGRSAAELVDTPAPQIEDPTHPITGAGDRPTPAGYGALGPSWSPRVEHAGTFDASWRKTRMPLMPVDFDLRHNNVAHPSLQFDKHLVAGDPIAILGMTAEGPWNFALPEIAVVLHGRYHDGRVVTVRPPVDTMLMEPLEDELQLTVRHAFPMGRGRTLLAEIRVDTDA